MVAVDFGTRVQWEGASDAKSRVKKEYPEAKCSTLLSMDGRERTKQVQTREGRDGNNKMLDRHKATGREGALVVNWHSGTTPPGTTDKTERAGCLNIHVKDGVSDTR